MRFEIDGLLRRAGGVTTRRRLLGVLTRNQLDDEIRRGCLVAVFPRTYARPWDADDLSLLERAALTSVGAPSVLSHGTAVRRRGVAVEGDVAVHVLVPAGRHPQSVAGRLVVHRTGGPIPRSHWVDGLPTVNLAAALPTLAPGVRRAPVIEATRRRLVSPAQVRDAVGTAGRVAKRGDLLHLLGLLEAGCESELEIWGLLHVFDVPGLRHAVRQKWVRTPERWLRLDTAFEDEMVAVELDGYAAHGSRAQRRRDLARDAALAPLGWLTIRFTHDQLTRDVAGCRRVLLDTLAARRAWPRSG